MKGLSDIFKTVDKMNPDGEILDESTLSTPSDWIDTGSRALNAIISGSLYKGVPVGRIVGLVGPSGAGKTLIINKILSNAQKKGYIAVIWDSEVAVDKRSAAAVGMDLKKTKYYPVDTVEDCRNQICLFLDNIIKTRQEDQDFKQDFIISIDSLGNLASSKELNDAAEGKSAADMGSRSKTIKSMMRTITYKAAKAKVPIIFSNHIYDSMALHPSLVQTQSGGKGPVYLASVLVQLSTRNEKAIDNPEEASVAIAHGVTGVTLGALTVKNRFVPNYLKTELYLNFKTGLDVNAGLFEMATSFGVLEKNGTRYSLQGENLGYRKDIEKNDEAWDKICPFLEKVLQEQLCYSNATTLTEDDLDVESDD